MKRIIPITLLCISALYGRKHPPPEANATIYFQGTIYEQTANSEFPGHFVFEPYFMFTNNYGDYKNNWSTERTPSQWEMQQIVQLETGITNWMDVVLYPTATYNQSMGTGYYGFADLIVNFGFQISRENDALDRPSLRFFIGETFPTGKYQNLSPSKEGNDAIGEGVYKTAMAIIYQKLFRVGKTEVYLNTSALYAFSLPTRVKGLNTYGGAHDTDAKVKPGDVFTGSLTYQIGITKQWIFATDFVYTYQKSTSSSGIQGTTNNLPTSLNAPASQQLICMPQIEYGIKKTYGIILGVGGTVFGRNTEAFTQIALSVNLAW